MLTNLIPHTIEHDNSDKQTKQIATLTKLEYIVTTDNFTYVLKSEDEFLELLSRIKEEYTASINVHYTLTEAQVCITV